jgi:hypothetical protein
LNGGTSPFAWLTDMFIAGWGPKWFGHFLWLITALEENLEWAEASLAVEKTEL